MRVVRSINRWPGGWRGGLFAGAITAAIAIALSTLSLQAALLGSPDEIFSQVLLKVPFYSDKTDQCGPATLAAVLSYWGKPTTVEVLRHEMYLAKLHGTLPMDLMLTAQSHGLKVQMIRGNLDTLRTELQAGRPVLAMMNLGWLILPVDHYVVVTGFDDPRQILIIHSAGVENQSISYKSFLRSWGKADDWAMTARLP